MVAFAMMLFGYLSRDMEKREEVIRNNAMWACETDRSKGTLRNVSTKLCLTNRQLKYFILCSLGLDSANCYASKRLTKINFHHTHSRGIARILEKVGHNVNMWTGGHTFQLNHVGWVIYFKRGSSYTCILDMQIEGHALR